MTAKEICILFALVAQLDRVSGYEPEGRGFESLRARQRSPVSFHRWSFSLPSFFIIYISFLYFIICVPNCHMGDCQIVTWAYAKLSHAATANLSHAAYANLSQRRTFCHTRKGLSKAAQLTICHTGKGLFKIAPRCRSAPALTLPVLMK